MNVLRAIVAALLVPVVLSLAYGFFELLIHLANAVSASAVPFWVGLGVYFLFQVLFARPIRTYVFGHELTHALVGLLSGARLKGFKVSAAGGSVALTKTNIAIALSPYFVPIYTVALLAAYWVAGKIWSPVTGYYPWVLFGVGFTLSFHVALTHFALTQGQSDLKPFGAFFSSVVILLVNCVVMVVILKLLFPLDVSVRGYGLDAARRAGGFYQWMGHEIWVVFQKTR